MKFTDLAKYKNNGVMMLKEPDLHAARTGGEQQESAIAIRQSTAQSQDAIAQVTGENILQLIKDGSGDGMWVPYLAQKSVYGFLSGSQTWAASGPYSGCYFEVGKLNGRIYVAHISCEGKNDANVESWNNAAHFSNKTILFSKKISLAAEFPEGTTNAATMVFANIMGESVSATRVDVQTKSAGGMNGPIFGVQQIDSD